MLLSRITEDPTVGSLRGEKEKRFYAGQATRGLRDREFLQTPRGRIFSLLEFLLPFKCFTNVSVE